MSSLSSREGNFDLRNHTVDYGVDEGAWPAFGLHRRDD